MELLNSKELEQVTGGTYWEGFKAVHKAIFWADKKGESETYFGSKKRQIKEGWDKAGSTGAKVGIVATDVGIAGTGVALIATGVAGTAIGAVKKFASKTKSAIKSAL